MFFDGFASPELITTPDGVFRLRRAGSGPVVLLLHGHPETHAMWHEVAPALARHFSVVCADLPGYGGSFADSRTDALAGTRHIMARRLLGLLDTIGAPRASVVGHDRGARVAHRMAIEAPDRIASLAVLDAVPVPEPVERSDMAFALATYRMFWFAQTHPKPEALFHTPPSDWFEGTLPGQDEHAHFAPEAIADYVASLGDADAMAAMNGAYRRATELDAIEDRIARAEDRRVTCPTLVLWGARGSIGGWYDPVSIWQDYVAAEVSGRPLDAGHFLAEEQPALTAQLLLEFLEATASGDQRS